MTLELVLGKEHLVAEIEAEVILGLDIPMKGDQSPSIIKLTEWVILINVFLIPCIHVQIYVNNNELKTNILHR